MTIKNLTEAELTNKRVLVRVDFNVPVIDDVIQDDTRIKAAIPTIDYLCSKGARVILLTHFGRPLGVSNEGYFVDHIAKHLSVCLAKPVVKCDDCIGAEVKATIASMQNGDVILLENTRFYPEEEFNDIAFCRKLAELADFFVQDAFGVAHRPHASIEGVPKLLPSYAGLLLDKELSVLGSLLQSPKRPFTAIIGGSKVSTKIGVLTALLNKVDTLVIGGAMTYTFLLALGQSIGTSLSEPEKVPVVLDFLQRLKQSSTRLYLPSDHVVATSLQEQDVSVVTEIPEGKMGLDIGPDSSREISDILSQSQTVLWNGPLGCFEFPAFAKGTTAIAQTLANLEATTVVGGGDSVSAIKQLGLEGQFSHVSTGGGACLAYLEGKTLPGTQHLKVLTS